MKYRVTVAGRCFEIVIDHDRLVWVDGKPMYVDMEQVGGLPVYSLGLDNGGYLVFVEEGQGNYRVEVQGQVLPVQVECLRPELPAPEHHRGPVPECHWGPVPEHHRGPAPESSRTRGHQGAALREQGPDDQGQCLLVSAPLAGHLISLAVRAGDRVEAGQAVAVVESMKMHMALKAPRAGVVEAVCGAPGQDVCQGEGLVVLRSE